MFGLAVLEKKKFDTTEAAQNPVGHSHNEQDQRFAESAEAIAKAKLLQTPPSFTNCLQTNMKGRAGRKVHVEQIHACYDWTSYFASLNVTMSGHAHTSTTEGIRY